MDNRPLYIKAIEKFGHQAQVIQFIEELNECAAALARCLNGKTGEIDAMEEIADVEIMVEQARLLFDSEEIEAQKQFKIERLKKYLREKKK